MATAEQIKPVEKKAYQMPDVEVGMPVRYFKDKNGPHCAGTVIGKGDRSVTLLYFPKNSQARGVQADGVKYITDPNPTAHDLEVAGFWDYLVRDKKLNELL